jgi:GT2 family glycosyltransferase
MRQDKNFISIIIPAYNNQKFIGRLLESILAQDGSYIKEVIVVDSGNDKTYDIAISYGSSFKARRIALKVVKVANLGVSYSRNFGAKMATSPLLFFIDGDCLLREDTISNIVNFFVDYRREEERIGVVQCKILHMRKELLDRIASAGAEISKLGYGWARLTNSTKNIPEANIPREVFCEGTGILLERSVYFDVGGFDEYFFYYFEPSDLSLKLILNGYKILYCPFAEIYDFKGGSRLSINPLERMKRFIKYHLAFLLKFYPVRYLVTVLPIALIIDLAIATIVGVKYGGFKPFLAFLRIIRDLPILLKKREHVKKLSKIEFKEIWNKMTPMKQDVVKMISVARNYGWL